MWNEKDIAFFVSHLCYSVMNSDHHYQTVLEKQKNIY